MTEKTVEKKNPNNPHVTFQLCDERFNRILERFTSMTDRFDTRMDTVSEKLDGIQKGSEGYRRDWKQFALTIISGGIIAFISFGIYTYC